MRDEIGKILAIHIKKVKLKMKHSRYFIDVVQDEATLFYLSLGPAHIDE